MAYWLLCGEPPLPNGLDTKQPPAPIPWQPSVIWASPAYATAKECIQGMLQQDPAARTPIAALATADWGQGGIVGLTGVSSGANPAEVAAAERKA